MPIRLAILVSHPIQHFAPWHRELAKISDIDLKVLFCCDWGVSSYVDPQFGTEVKWDIPLLEGYTYEFLPLARRPQRLRFWDVDNPSVGSALDRFQPDVVKLFGYAHRTNWRAAAWARRNRRPVLLYSDSNANTIPIWWKRPIKNVVVRRFYGHVDGALFVGDNNRGYHLRYGIPPERLFPGVLPVDGRVLRQPARDCALTRSEVRSRLCIPQDAFVVLFCGKLSSGKRPIDLLSAVQLTACRGLSAWLLFVGDGERRLKIEHLCGVENLQNVRLAGFVNQSAVGAYYAAVDAIAVTSELDAHPLVVSEAASFGLPVIVSDRVGCIGPNDSAQPGTNAIVYPCGDVQALAQAIERLMCDPALYRRMSAASSLIGTTQDVTVAAQQLASAVRQLRHMGPRLHDRKRLNHRLEAAV